MIGVLDDWFPRPRFYDLNGGDFQPPGGRLHPLRLGHGARAAQQTATPTAGGPRRSTLYKDFLALRLHLAADVGRASRRRSRERMQAVMDGYWAEQHKAGRFERPRDNRLTNVGSAGCSDQQGGRQRQPRAGGPCVRLPRRVSDQHRGPAARQIPERRHRSPACGARSAPAAGRSSCNIWSRSAACAVLGALLGPRRSPPWAARRCITCTRPLTSVDRGGYQELMHFDSIGVALGAWCSPSLATLAAGLYPAWRVGRLPPARYLKSQ